MFTTERLDVYLDILSNDGECEDYKITNDKVFNCVLCGLCKRKNFPVTNKDTVDLITYIFLNELSEEESVYVYSKRMLLERG